MFKLCFLLSLAFCVAELSRDREIPPDVQRELQSIVDDIDQTVDQAGSRRGLSLRQLRGSVKNISQKIKETSKSLARKHPEVAEKGLKYLQEGIVKVLDKRIEEAQSPKAKETILKLAKGLTPTLEKELKRKLLDGRNPEGPQNESQYP